MFSGKGRLKHRGYYTNYTTQKHIFESLLRKKNGISRCPRQLPKQVDICESPISGWLRQELVRLVDTAEEEQRDKPKKAQEWSLFPTQPFGADFVLTEGQVHDPSHPVR